MSATRTFLGEANYSAPDITVNLGTVPSDCDIGLVFLSVNQTNGSPDVDWDGVAMTEHPSSPTTVAGFGRMRVFTLENPATGAGLDVVVTAGSGAMAYNDHAWVYSGEDIDLVTGAILDIAFVTGEDVTSHSATLDIGPDDCVVSAGRDFDAAATGVTPNAGSTEHFDGVTEDGSGFAASWDGTAGPTITCTYDDDSPTPFNLYGNAIFVSLRGNSGGFTITAESTSYAITGTDADPRASRQVVAESATMVWTGTDAGVLVGRLVDAESAAALITGTDAELIPPAPGLVALRRFRLSIGG